MAEQRRIRPDYEEPIGLDEPIEFEDAVQRLLNAPADSLVDEGEVLDGEDS